MRTITFIVLSAVLVIQSTNAFPQLRSRRDVKHDLELSPEVEKKRADLFEFIVDEMIDAVKNVVKNQKEFFEKVVKHAEEADHKSDDLKTHLEKFTNIIARASSTPEAKDEETIDKLFILSGEAIELADKYDDIENPTEEEKLIRSLLDDNGPKVRLEFVANFMKLHSNYKSHIEGYVDSLSEDDKAKDAKFIEWFEKFKAVKGLENLVDVTMDVFDFLDDDSDKKKE